MRSVFVCPCCGHGFRRAVVPAGALADAQAELELLRVSWEQMRDSLEFSRQDAREQAAEVERLLLALADAAA